MEVAAYLEPSVPRRKRAFGTCKAKTEVSIFGNVDDDTERAREVVRQRSRSELVAARGLLEEALAALSSPSSPEEALKSLHIVEYNMARPDSLLRQLGLFLKVDDYDIGIEEEQQHHHCQSFHEDLEEGEIPA